MHCKPHLRESTAWNVNTIQWIPPVKTTAWGHMELTPAAYTKLIAMKFKTKFRGHIYTQNQDLYLCGPNFELKYTQLRGDQRCPVPLCQDWTESVMTWCSHHQRTETKSFSHAKVHGLRITAGTSGWGRTSLLQRVKMLWSAISTVTTDWLG